MDTELELVERRARAIGAGLLAMFAVLGAVGLLLVPLGETYDSDCGTLLQRERGLCEGRATSRLVLVVAVLLVAAGLCAFAIRSAPRPASVVQVLAPVAAVIAALVIVGAPYSVGAPGIRGFDLDCAGLFSSYGGNEHPPPGGQEACDREERKHLVVAGVVVLAGTAVAVAARRRSRVSA